MTKFFKQYAGTFILPIPVLAGLIAFNLLFWVSMCIIALGLIVIVDHRPLFAKLK